MPTLNEATCFLIITSRDIKDYIYNVTNDLFFNYLRYFELVKF